MNNWTQLECMLKGESLGVELQTCDFERGLAYENLIVKQNVVYIVAAVIFNEKNEVLMVQEAKPSCYQKWYLPAGRMEPNETIVAAAKREVMEEAGLDFEPESLLCIEECGGKWVRFTLTGKEIGGKLKTTEDADEESLQAMWWNRTDQIMIRCKDIFHLIQRGSNWRSKESTPLTRILPSPQTQKLLFLRLLIVSNISSDHNFNASSHCFLHRVVKPVDDTELRDENEEAFLPTCRLHHADLSFLQPVLDLCQKVIGNECNSTNISINRVLGVEHNGQSQQGRDGLGINILVDFKTETSPVSLRSSDFVWTNISEIENSSTVELFTKLLGNYDSPHVIPVFSLKQLRL